MKNIEEINIEDELYPKALKEIHNPPQKLFVLGNKNLLKENCLSIIGSRKATDYGITIAEKFSQNLAKQGICIVSGMAEGVDSAAHCGALLAGGVTVAVSGRGLDDAYPKFHRKLMEQIIETGMLISEYPPYAEPKRQHFPERNRIISGICSGTVVVEAPKRSGSLITANYALEQDRDVFAVPGDITREKSVGANNLIKEGAVPVTSARDIVEYYSYEYTDVKTKEQTEEPKEVKTTLDDKMYNDLTEEEKRVVRKLSLTPVNFDMLLAATGMAPDKLTSLITMLEIKGKVKTHPGKKFTLNT